MLNKCFFTFGGHLNLIIYTISLHIIRDHSFSTCARIVPKITFLFEQLEAATGGVLKKKLFLKISQKHRKTPVSESLF